MKIFGMCVWFTPTWTHRAVILQKKVKQRWKQSKIFIALFSRKEKCEKTNNKNNQYFEWCASYFFLLFAHSSNLFSLQNLPIVKYPRLIHIYKEIGKKGKTLSKNIVIEQRLCSRSSAMMFNLNRHSIDTRWKGVCDDLTRSDFDHFSYSYNR